MANEVFFFDSSDVGAPTLNNAAGTIISVLDACLVNGFNSKSVTSIVVVSNVATVTCTSHGFVAVPGKYVEIAGATPSGLNGMKLLTAVTNANTFTFAAPGISDQTATGTITAKRAAIGWGKAFSGTNKAAYRSADVAGTRLYLRIDDTNTGAATATDARVVMYESMSDVDTGTAANPPTSFIGQGLFWNKGVNSATAKTWVVVGDGRLFYLFTQSASTTANLIAVVFGDIVSYRAADAYGCMLTGASAAYSGASGASLVLLNTPVGTAPTTFAQCLARIASATGSSVRAATVMGGIVGQTIGHQSGNIVFPSPVDNGLVFVRPILIAEEGAGFGHPIRGELPGLLAPLAGLPFTHLDVVTGLTGLTGSILMIGTSSSGNPGRVALDISNAWRA